MKLKEREYLVQVHVFLPDGSPGISTIHLSLTGEISSTSTIADVNRLASRIIKDIQVLEKGRS